ncbi:hypothetical protein [Nocardia bovistercoris]|uniref:Uncharacterized protein n=1 Tax=Nocardia bovistercoris TaxID=2785916 RepID=A0A931I8P2_9NOCA|nr:hypothetical protein [Nocardia bovistercoris]MBH0776997.1 hypothetical protein [Nocardia bovistercoris]
MDPTWIRERENWFSSIVLDASARETPDIAGVPDASRKVHNFPGMTPATAARMIERIEARRAMVESVLAPRPVSQQHAGFVSKASPGYGDPGIVAPGGDFPGDKMPEVPPNIPPGTHRVPEVPDENGNTKLPYRYEDGPPPPPDQNDNKGGAGGGAAGGSGKGGSKGNGNGNREQTKPPWPNNGADIGPPGTQPGTEQGKPYTHVDPEGNWDERYPHGDPVPVPSEHTLPDPSLSAEPDLKQAQQNPSPAESATPTTPAQPGAGGSGGSQSQPTPQTSETPGGGTPSTTDPSENGGDSPGADGAEPAVSAPQQAPSAEEAPQPENPESKEPQPYEGPGFLLSLVPVVGSALQAYADFKNGRWVWGLINVAFAISDLFLVKSLFTVGGKLLWKLGQTLLRDPAAIGKALAGMVEGIGAGIGKAAEAAKNGIGNAYNKAKEVLGGIFRSGGRESADDAARRAQEEFAEQQWREALERSDQWKPNNGPRRKPVWKRSGDGFDDLREDLEKAFDSIPNTPASKQRTHASAVYESGDGTKIPSRASSGQDSFLDRKNVQMPGGAREPGEAVDRFDWSTVNGVPRNADAELKILEDLRTKLRPDSGGRIRMVVDYPGGDKMHLGEDIICSSCQGVLAQFTREFPRVSIDIRDMYGRRLFEYIPR